MVVVMSRYRSKLIHYVIVMYITMQSSASSYDSAVESQLYQPHVFGHSDWLMTVLFNMCAFYKSI